MIACLGRGCLFDQFVWSRLRGYLFGWFYCGFLVAWSGHHPLINTLLVGLAVIVLPVTCFGCDLLIVWSRPTFVPSQPIGCLFGRLSIDWFGPVCLAICSLGVTAVCLVVWSLCLAAISLVVCSLDFGTIN